LHNLTKVDAYLTPNGTTLMLNPASYKLIISPFQLVAYPVENVSTDQFLCKSSIIGDLVYGFLPKLALVIALDALQV